MADIQDHTITCDSSSVLEESPDITMAAMMYFGRQGKSYDQIGEWARKLQLAYNAMAEVLRSHPAYFWVTEYITEPVDGHWDGRAMYIMLNVLDPRLLREIEKCA